MSDSDDVDWDDDEFFQDLKNKRLEQNNKDLKQIETNNLFFNKNIKPNIWNNIDYKYAYDNQSKEQKDAIDLYIIEGQAINEHLRTSGYDPKSNSPLNQNVKTIDNNIFKIKQPKYIDKSYYPVYRCMKTEYDKSFSSGYTSTNSNGVLPGFGVKCIKIYVPIDTPILVGNLKDVKYKNLFLASYKDKRISGNLGYEIMLPRGSVLAYTGIIEESLKVYYLEEIIKEGGKGKNIKIKNVKSYTSIKNKNKNKNKIKFKNAYFPSLINNKPIKNTYNLNKCMLITGPNAAGKTTLIKTTLFNILCCQQMGFGFFDKCLFDPFDYIHSYINIPDITGRDSLFQSEARRCKNILDIIMENGKEKSHFCVFDELFSGTNPYEAIASSVSFLRYLKNNTNSINMITTHFLNICNKMEKEENVSSMYMEILNSNTNINDFSYTYKIKKGISHIKGGVKVLKDLGYPQLIIDDTIKLINQ